MSSHCTDFVGGLTVEYWILLKALTIVVSGSYIREGVL